jgi:hypothetical protein
MINHKKQRTDLKAVRHDLGTRSDDQQPECRSQKYPILRIEIARIIAGSNQVLGAMTRFTGLAFSQAAHQEKEELAMIW